MLISIEYKFLLIYFVNSPSFSRAFRTRIRRTCRNAQSESYEETKPEGMTCTLQQNCAVWLSLIYKCRHLVIKVRIESGVFVRTLSVDLFALPAQGWMWIANTDNTSIDTRKWKWSRKNLKEVDRISAEISEILSQWVTESHSDHQVVSQLVSHFSESLREWMK